MKNFLHRGRRSRRTRSETRWQDVKTDCRIDGIPITLDVFVVEFRRLFRGTTSEQLTAACFREFASEVQFFGSVASCRYFVLAWGRSFVKTWANDAHAFSNCVPLFIFGGVCSLKCVEFF